MRGAAALLSGRLCDTAGFGGKNDKTKDKRRITGKPKERYYL